MEETKLKIIWGGGRMTFLRPEKIKVTWAVPGRHRCDRELQEEKLGVAATSGGGERKSRASTDDPNGNLCLATLFTAEKIPNSTKYRG